MKTLLISACLLGIPCRYNGEALESIDLDEIKKKYFLVPVCPEIYGGLSTPREASERMGDLVITNSGRNVTAEYNRGARIALDFASKFKCNAALLKNNSPSCGTTSIYDGTFTGKKIAGMGVTADLLRQSGVCVYNESQINLLLLD